MQTVRQAIHSISRGCLSTCGVPVTPLGPKAWIEIARPPGKYQATCVFSGGSATIGHESVYLQSASLIRNRSRCPNTVPHHDLLLRIRAPQLHSALSPKGQGAGPKVHARNRGIGEDGRVDSPSLRPEVPEHDVWSAPSQDLGSVTARYRQGRTHEVVACQDAADIPHRPGRACAVRQRIPERQGVVQVSFGVEEDDVGTRGVDLSVSLGSGVERTK